MVVGSGAVKFAINQGFLMESNTDILSEMTMKAYEVRLLIKAYEVASGA